MRVLVAAASKYGATAGIAEAIGRKIEEHAELDVDVVPVADVDDLTGYDAVILGSGVYAGRWLKDARRFVGEHAGDLAAIPTWLFSSGPIGDPAKPEGEAAVRLGSIAGEVGAIEHRVFAGRLEKSRLAFGDRAIVTAVRSPEGDFRDWEAIARWAAEITEALAPARPLSTASTSTE